MRRKGVMFMDDTKQRNLTFIIIFLILAIFVSIAVRNNPYLKKSSEDEANASHIQEKFEDGSKNINQYKIVPEEDTNIETETETQEENKNEEKQIEDNSSTKHFYSKDDKYYLVLTESNRNYSNQEMGKKDYRFLLNIDNYLSTESITGTYEIKDNKITLNIEAGCMDEKGNFNCVMPDGITIVKKNNAINTMTLDYSDNVIKLGNINLTIR